MSARAPDHRGSPQEEGCGRGKKKVKNIVTLPLSPISPFDKTSFGILYYLLQQLYLALLFFFFFALKRFYPFLWSNIVGFFFSIFKYRLLETIH